MLKLSVGKDRQVIKFNYIINNRSEYCNMLQRQENVQGLESIMVEHDRQGS